MIDNDYPAETPRVGGRAAGSQIEVWLDEARAGSTAALGSLLQGCRKYLLLMANEALDSDLRPRAAASDLVQDSFVEVQQDFENFRGTTEGQLISWLTGILANRLANNVRYHRHTDKRSVTHETPLERVPERALDSVCDEESPSDVVIAGDEARRVQAALARLPEPLREVLVLRTWELKSFVQIGDQLNKTPDTARKLWGRAVRRLKEELQRTR